MPIHVTPQANGADAQSYETEMGLEIGKQLSIDQVSGLRWWDPIVRERSRGGTECTKGMFGAGVLCIVYPVRGPLDVTMIPIMYNSIYKRKTLVSCVCCMDLTTQIAYATPIHEQRLANYGVIQLCQWNNRVFIGY